MSSSLPPRLFYSSNRNLKRTVISTPTMEPTIKREEKERTFNGMSAEQITLMVCPSQFRQVYIKITDTIGEKFKEQGLKIENKQTVSGPLEVLINWAVTPENLESNFANMFILNYHTYCKPIQLLSVIDKICNDIVESKNEPVKTIKQKWAKITIFMKIWTDLLPYDFHDKEILGAIETFLQKYQSQFVGIAQIRKMIQAAQSIPHLPTFERIENSNGEEKTKPVKELTAETIVGQLSLYELTLFTGIEMKDFLGSAWTKKDKYERCPRLCEFLEHFNAVTNWVSYSILQESDINARANLISKFIDVAKIMYEQMNFTGFFEFYSGLNSSAISRLTKTWELVENAAQRMDPLRKAADPTRSYASYRKYIQQNKSKGYIPFIGVIIQDLTFIDEGNPDKTESGDVNFEKCRMMANQLLTIRPLQNDQHSIYKALPFFKDFILSIEQHKNDDEKAQYDISLQIQPRN
ncbi:Ras guanine nucleotide exchange factor, putative [Entamoeba histolytica HM-3:IMSS]|uniref:Ras guanine nucleotide exchange factor, putative n=5 Tax=Entamoeba histolytica TaxID=5759 RepID=C4LV04_ENTH1|nr:Ras guanine nucleotide exchange factor, putative [Entamoeba histolytica HM-1:IMSS]EMD44486.1 Ras guanine nucleotide exchange factor, putative [Entamoeba histolytica KU27]EMS17086.1 Ras guanine nucleotide exchange factor, putative [Entamoeba histolytica HM-3:IMSS]ENY63162.1 Ras guanine nucleotide exchange factor, putative [Entamoeba histolytica HM-1:IMSS-A]GAT92475.1 Ras guanine nucleotide exchange factor putative [Entamoeba histolytica]EAL50212.1 Ras guanine nucleotide exchange factor, puta|eukprot:XP_655598.1 Ras guanine nucleotide exchange factor, putative [Entamoeba histolytica HM-1:IMSS]